MTRLIKKYKNRRLYDTDLSQYITIDDLEQYVIQGIDFKVEDSKTGRDLTNSTLLQIFIEMESGASQFLSSAMLKQLIVIAQHPMNQAVKTILEQVIEHSKKFMNAELYMQNPQKFNEAWQKQMQTFAQQWQNFFKA